MPAIATDFRTDADRLREQAQALQRHAEAMQEERMELLREAWSLEAEANRLDRENDDTKRVPIIATATSKPETDTRFLERVVAYLDTVEEASSTDVAEHLAVTQTRARTGLARLEAIGMVRRTGLKRGTRYRLVGEDDESADVPAGGSVHPLGNYENLVRDAALKLGTFEYSDLQRELPTISENTLRRWLRAFVERGWFEEERVDGHKVYAYVPPEGSTTARPTHARPEDVARDTVSRGEAVAGVGRARVGSPIVDALIREVADYGITVTTSKHRVEYRKDGQIIATSSKTPSASSLKGTRGQLRRAGVPV